MTREINRGMCRAVHETHQGMEETVTTTRNFDMVRSKIFKHYSVRSLKLHS